MSGKIHDSYIESIKKHSKLVNQTFKNTLGLLPNGVLIIDLISKRITFANMEMSSLFGSSTDPNYTDSNEKVREMVSKFILVDNQM
jgi:hypothetical protein